MDIASLYKKSGSDEWKNTWLFWCSMTLMVGIYLSPALMSIGMMATGLFLFTPGALAQVKTNLREQPLYVFLLGIFVLYFVSGLYSDNLDYWMERVQIKLPYLLLPLSFAAVRVNQKTLYRILYVLFITVLLGAIGSLINFALNYEEITYYYIAAKTMPTPFSVGHIRFSLMTAFSAGIGWILFKDRFVFRWAWERKLFLYGVLFLVVFLHILSVRSGLLAFYAAAVIYIVVETLRSQGFKKTVLYLLLLACVPLVMYALSPTLQRKVEYMISDVSRFKDGQDVNDYSDGNRLLSWQLGWRVGNENPLLGAGIGDVLDKVHGIYEEEYPGISAHNRLIPHSQFVYLFAGCGWIGLLWFTLTCFYPYVDSRLRKNTLLLVFNTIIVTSFISESTLEIQLGVALHLFFLLLVSRQWTVDS